LNKIKKNKFVLLAFVLVLLLSATLRNGFIIEATCQKTTTSDSFPQAGKFYTLAGRSVSWEVVDGENVTTSHDEEIYKWSIQDVVGDVAFVNRTYVDAYIRPQTGGNYTDTYDFDYEIAINRTILSAYLKEMSFDTTGFQWSSERPLGEDVGEHTWGWFPTDLHIGAYVLVSWTFDNNFLGDMLYEVVGEEVIQVVGQKQDCWMLRMPPSVTIDGTQWRTETVWVDKDTGIPLKWYTKGWALDGSSGFDCEYVLVHTNIDLGPESTQPASPTYTLTVPTTSGFPEAGKFYTWYLLEDGWYKSGGSNVTYYDEGLFTIWVVNVTGDEAFVYRILWFEEGTNAAERVKELEAAGIQYHNYTINIKTREILSVTGTFYSINMTSLIYGKYDQTSQLTGDIGEETYYWLPTNLNIGASVKISWPRDNPIDNGTYTVIGQNIICVLDKPQECWILYMPPTPSIDSTWNYTETCYSDKDTGIPLCDFVNGMAIDGTSADYEVLRFIGTNVDLGPQMYVFPIIADSQNFYVKVVTNSTILIQAFNFSKEEMKISYNVTGSNLTMGFCNVTIPKKLLGGPWTIKVGVDIMVPEKNEDDNYTYLYFKYSHSIHRIEIIGNWVIPEFPSLIILPLLMIATLLTIMVYRRKQE
jgi:hypothetical protein